MIRFLLCAVFLIAAGPALAAEAPPGNIYNHEPFSNGAYFSSVACLETFPCESYATPEQYIEAADNCASTRRGYPKGMMRYFETEGVYQNCVLPDTYAPKTESLGAAAQWPICCIGEIENQPGMCRFTCHSYISN